MTSQKLHEQVKTSINDRGNCLNTCKFFNSQNWLIDSDCDYHMVRDKNKINNLKLLYNHMTVNVANGYNLKLRN